MPKDDDSLLTPAQRKEAKEYLKSARRFTPEEQAREKSASKCRTP